VRRPRSTARLPNIKVKAAIADVGSISGAATTGGALVHSHSGILKDQSPRVILTSSHPQDCLPTGDAEAALAANKNTAVNASFLTTFFTSQQVKRRAMVESYRRICERAMVISHKPRSVTAYKEYVKPRVSGSKAMF
jgi:hypothetical protein